MNGIIGCEGQFGGEESPAVETVGLERNAVVGHRENPETLSVPVRDES